MLGLQLRQQGNTAEVRLQLRQGDGVVEAALRETARGVEILLLAGPEHQPLLTRVAETLAAQRGDQAFDLDGVTVDTQGDPTHSQRRDRGADSQTGRSGARRQRRAAGQPGLPPAPLLSDGTSYLR